MSAAARGLLRNLRSKRATLPSSTDGLAPSAIVSVSSPADVPHAYRSSLITQIHAQIRDGCTALGISRAIEMVDEPADASAARTTPSIYVSIDGRPAVLIDAEPYGADGIGWVKGTAHRIAAVLQYRYALFLDPTERARHAESIRDATSDDRAELYRNVPDYLLENGVSLRRIGDSLDGAPVKEPSPAAVAEVVLDALAPDVMEVELALDSVRHATDDDIELVTMLRARVFADTGVQFPDIRLRPDPDPSTPLRLRLNDVWIDTELDGTAGWREVTAVIERAVRARASWFVRSRDTAHRRDQLADIVGALIELSRTSYSDAVVTATLRALVRSGHSVRNLQRILWLLHDTAAGPETTAVRYTNLNADVAADPRDEPEAIAARIRTRIADESWRAGGLTPESPAVTVPANLANDLLAADPNTRTAAERQVLTACQLHGVSGPVLAPRVDAIAALRFSLSALSSPPIVVAIQELPIDFPTTPLRM